MFVVQLTMENSMKKLIGIMFYLLILTGCTDQAEEIAMIEEASESTSGKQTYTS